MNPSLDIDFNNNDIIKILQQYKNKRLCEHKRYHEVLKVDPQFKLDNNNRSKEYYNSHKEVIKCKYENTKDIKNAKSLYRYYKKNNILHLFEVRHSEKLKLLKLYNHN